MSPQGAHFIWNAEVIADRGPIDEPLLLTATVKAQFGNDAPYTELVLEENAVNYIGEQTGLDPATMTVVSLTWTVWD